MTRNTQTAPTPAERLLSPFQEFLHLETSGGIVLLICTAAALVWANIPSLAPGYVALWQKPIVVGIGGFVLAKPALLWINDGLMAVFFFVVGLEIKRELLSGELSSPRQAALPAAAALGGMVVPALIYTLFNAGGPASAGWGVPMATDIAFALGVLALLGKGVPLPLKIFLAALAIVDDLGAVLVIALFFTAELVWPALIVAGVLVALLVAVNRLGVRNPLVYILLGMFLWLAVLKSGIHATIAGVILAMTIPSTARLSRREVAARSIKLIRDFTENETGPPESVENQQATLQALEAVVQSAESPLQRFEHALHPWVSFLIMPVFALANAGVTLGTEFLSRWSHPVTLGVAAGLILGKQIGITSFTWIAVKTGIASLPAGISWRHIYGVAWLGGIGFTMSLFIADLAFGDAPDLQLAKVGILFASLISGIAGWSILKHRAGTGKT
jgi:NhaA family Na+:H+ antiporter